MATTKKPAGASAAKPAAKRPAATAPAAKQPTATKPVAKPSTKPAPTTAGEVVLLAGGNPQIPKGDGDAPVQAYIAAMPGWKHDVGRELDALIEKAVPKVRKAVRWNSPFYGSEKQGWFLNFHCFTKFVRVAFFDGKSLDPVPPVASKDPKVQYLDIHEDKPLDAKQFVAWVKQASKLPGWDGS